MTGLLPPDDLVGGFDPSLVNAVLMTESGGRQNAVSPKGATGLMQLMPGTARDLGVDPANPADNLEGGSRYLQQMMDRYGDQQTALMAYNWGPGNVDRWLATGRTTPVPAETRTYVQRVLSRLNPIGSAQAQEMPPDDLISPPDDLVAAGPPDDLMEPPPDLVGGSPGIVGAFKSGFGSGVSQLGEQASTLGNLAAGTADIPAPQEPDALAEKYRDVPFLDKVTDPTWLSYFIGQTIPGSAPFMAGAIAGGAAGSVGGPVGTLIGAMVGGGTAAGAQSLADSYNEARNSGRDHEAALDYAMKQAAMSAGINAASIPAGVWGLAKGPVSYAIKQLIAQPLIGAGGQVAENVYAKGSGVDPTRETLAGVPESMLGEVLFEAPAQAFAMRKLAPRVEGEPPPAEPSAPPPAEPPVPVGERVVLGLEETGADETGQPTRTTTNEDVTVQGYDPATGLLTVTRDSDGASLGEMSVEDFQRLWRQDLAPHEPAIDQAPPQSLSEPLGDPTLRDAAIADADARGLSEEPFTPPKDLIAPPVAMTEADFLARDAAMRQAEEAGRTYPAGETRRIEPELPGLPPAEPKIGEPPLRLFEDIPEAPLAAERPAEPGVRARMEAEAARYLPDGTDFRAMTDAELLDATEQARAADAGEAPETMFERQVQPPADLIGTEERLAPDLTGTKTVENAARRDSVQTAVREALEPLIGKGVDARVYDQLLGKWDGQWHPVAGAMEPVERVIAASLDSPDIGRTIRHEAVHWLSQAGVISPDDTSILNKQAEKWGKTDYADVAGKYPDLSPEARAEEVVAHAFSDWRKGRLNVSGPVRKIFQRVADFLDSLKTRLGLRKARTWRDVFNDIEGGKFADKAGQRHEVKKTGGGFDLTERGEPVGWYPSRAKAVDAALAREAETAGSEALETQAEAAYDEVASGIAANDKPARVIAAADRISLFERKPQREMLKDLGRIELRKIFPRTLAMMDRPFARLYDLVQRREDDQTRNYRDFFLTMKPVGALKPESRQNVYKAATLARLQARNIVSSGANLIIKNGPDAVTDPSTGKVWIAPNEAVKLTQAETQAYFALKATMRQVWGRYTTAVIRKLGYEGDIQELRDAAKTPESRDAYLDQFTGRGRDSAEQALTTMADLQDQERSGYIPFMRHGDVMIVVMPKTESLKTSAGDLGGKVDPLWAEFVDTDTPLKNVFGRKSAKGDYGKSVAERVKELKARYPDGVVLEPRYISERGTDDLPLPVFEKLVNGLAGKNPNVADDLYRQFVSDVYSNARAGWRKQARNIGGFSTDFDRVLADYLSHTARVLPMVEHGNVIDAQKDRLINGTVDREGKKVPPEGTPSVRRFADTWMQYVDGASNDWATTRKLGFLWWLWGNASSAVVNLSQTPLVTIPTLGKWGGYARAALETNKLAATILRPDQMMTRKRQWGADGGKIVLNIDAMRINDAEKALLKDLERDGTLQAQVTSDMQGMNLTKSPATRGYARGMQKIYESGASLFGAAEVTNRAIAALAAYRLAQQPSAIAKAEKVYGQNQLFQQEMRGKITPEKLAKWAVLESQFQSGKTNTPEIMRGIGAPLMQFKKFTAQYLSLLWRQALYEGAPGKAAATVMLAALVMSSGLRGVPFADDLTDLYNWSTEMVTGVNPRIELELKDWARGKIDGMTGSQDWARLGSEMLLNGPSRELTGLDMGQRFGQGDLVPNNPFDVLGPAAGIIGSFADAKQFAKVGQDYQALSRTTPKALGSVIEGLGYQEQGVTTKSGNRVMMPSEMTGTDAAKKALGFQPAELARRQEAIFDLSKIDMDARKAAAGFYRKLANSIALAIDARKSGDGDRADEFMARFQRDLGDYQKKIADPDVPAYVKQRFNRESLNREIKNALDWSRRFTKQSPKQARPEILDMLQKMGSSIGEDVAVD